MKAQLTAVALVLYGQALAAILPTKYGRAALDADLRNATSAKVALMGSAETVLSGMGFKLHLLGPPGGGRCIPESVLDYDLLILNWAYLDYTEADRELLRRFLRAGKGLLLTAGVPVMLGRGQGEALLAADFLGAKTYVNFGGEIAVTRDCYITQDLDPTKLLFHTGEACGGLMNPTTGAVLLNHLDQIVALANEFEGGRVAFLWEIRVNNDLDPQVMRPLVGRTLCWLLRCDGAR